MLRVMLKMPSLLTPTTRCQAWTGRSKKAPRPPTPALLTGMSILPKRRRVSAVSCATSSTFETSEAWIRQRLLPKALPDLRQFGVPATTQYDGGPLGVKTPRRRGANARTGARYDDYFST